MKNLEKMLFLEMTMKQFANLPDTTYYETYKSLSKEQLEEFTKLSQELHNIWTFINGRAILNVLDNEGVETILDYNDKITTVSAKIMRIAKDFDLTLKDEMTEDVKNAIISICGLEYYLQNFGKP